MPSITYFNALYSCYKADPALSKETRTASKDICIQGNVFTANAHLRIADQVMDAKTTKRQFYSYLDKHVFFWPTPRDCQKMLEIYSRREPDEAFAILQLDTYSLLCDFYDTVKLSKYDSGSSPRYPTRCSYKKSLQMFLTLNEFEITREALVPSKPSEIREVLVEDKVTNLSHYIQAVYSGRSAVIPGSLREYAQSFDDFII